MGFLSDDLSKMGGLTPQRISGAEKWKVTIKHEEDGGPSPARVMGPDQGDL